ncbi:hypothetical protein MHYP_G00162550 [Metynnis hypsauchen]
MATTRTLVQSFTSALLPLSRITVTSSSSYKRTETPVPPLPWNQAEHAHAHAHSPSPQTHSKRREGARKCVLLTKTAR